MGATPGPDPSASVSSVFLFLDACQASHQAGTVTEIPRLAPLARNDKPLPVIPSAARNLSRAAWMRFLDSLRSLGMTKGAVLARHEKRALRWPGTTWSTQRQQAARSRRSSQQDVTRDSPLRFVTYPRRLYCAVDGDDSE